jgi:hypothetical protein
LYLRQAAFPSAQARKRLATAGGSLQNDVVTLLNVSAACEAKNLSPVKMTVGVVLNILNHSAGRGEAGLVDEADELVLLPPVPFRINHQGKSVLKAELAEGAGVLHLALKTPQPYR